MVIQAGTDGPLAPGHPDCNDSMAQGGLSQEGPRACPRAGSWPHGVTEPSVQVSCGFILKIRTLFSRSLICLLIFQENSRVRQTQLPILSLGPWLVPLPEPVLPSAEQGSRKHPVLRDSGRRTQACARNPGSERSVSGTCKQRPSCAD